MFIERTVAVLEKMATPDAVVQHDQKLPELVTGIRRQCDVVVRYGLPPQQTLAIVEIQDRKNKVGLPTFDSWRKKQEKLGAQHLICVSRMGFTKSVEAEVGTMGDTVRLMTLCEPNSRPPFLATTDVLWNLQVVEQRDATVVYDQQGPTPANLTLDDKVFLKTEGGQTITLFSLADEAWAGGTVVEVAKELIDRNHFKLMYRVDFGSAGRSLLLSYGGKLYSIHEVHYVDLRKEVQQSLAVVALAYEQRNIDNSIAWVLFGRGSYEGQEVYFRQPFVKLPDGSIRMGPTAVSKLAGHSRLAEYVQVVRSVPFGSKKA